MSFNRWKHQKNHPVAKARVAVADKNERRSERGPEQPFPRMAGLLSAMPGIEMDAGLIFTL